MGNKPSLMAKWINKCDREIDKKCQENKCGTCRYEKICRKVAELNYKFKKRGYLK